MIDKNEVKFNFIKTAVLYGIFAFFTLLVKVFDVSYYLSDNEFKIGFSNLNKNFNHKITYTPSIANKSDFFLGFTDALAYIAIAVMVAFAVIGILQLVFRKSFKKVDYQIYSLAVVYVLLFAFYGLFEVAIVNYRPIMVEGIYEASYPSSHTMLAVVSFCTAISEGNRLFGKQKKVKIAITVSFSILIALAIIGRMLCGYHWLTDILGGILLSIALIETYSTLVFYGDYKHQKIKIKVDDEPEMIQIFNAEPEEIDITNL